MVRLAPIASPAASPGWCRPEAIAAVIISSGSAPASKNAAANTVILSPRAAAPAFSVNSSAPAISITADTASSPSPQAMPTTLKPSCGHHYDRRQRPLCSVFLPGAHLVVIPDQPR